MQYIAVCIIIFALFFLFIPLLISFRTIKQNHVAIVERFGKFTRVIGPGLRFLIPYIEKIAADIDLAMQNMTFELETVSNDKVIVRLKANLIFSIDKASVTEFYYKLDDPSETLKSFVENYVRSFVSTESHEKLLEKREEISDYLIKHLDTKMSTWGIKIASFQVMDIVFPNVITEAMSRVVASQRLKEAAMNEAEAKKITVVKQAEAEKESRILLGEGVAGERQAIVDGLKKSIDDMKTVKGLNTQEVMNLVALSQYFDTMKAIGDAPNSKVLFVNPNPKGVNDILQQMTGAIEGTKK